MRLPGRLITLSAGIAIAAAATLSAGAQAPTPSPPAPAPSTQPCFASPAPGTLPRPPVIDTTVAGNASFDLYVKQGAQTPQTAPDYLYCYVSTQTGAASYVEAPTIRVKQGGTFTMTLHNQIPYSGPSATPTPPQKILYVPNDDCAWLPFDAPRLPTPNPSTSPPGYFGRRRVPQNPSPPWMLSNDTNFHTHGWHVSPYVDNVYKSMVWAKTPNTCVFKFTVRRSQPPGTYWYHAHLHGLSNNQVGGGLAGALIVVPASPDPSAVREDGDVVLLIKNSAVNQAPAATPSPAPQLMGAMAGMGHGPERPVPLRHYNALAASAGPPRAHALGAAAASPVPFDPFSPPPWNSGWPWPATTNYCSPPGSNPNAGDPLAVNGQLIPAVYGGTTYPSTPPAIVQRPGTIYRYRIINAASNAYVNVHTVTPNGTNVPLNIVARDGVPVNWDKITASVDHTRPSIVREPNVFVPPSGRVDILVVGSLTPLQIISAEGSLAMKPSADGTPFCTGYVGSAMPKRIILNINPGRVFRQVLGARALTTKTGLTAAGHYAQLARTRNVIRRALTFTMYLDNGAFSWNVTETGAQSAPFAKATPLPFVERPFWLAQSTVPPNNTFPYVPWIRVHQGDFEEWSLFNATPEVHAFHIHQLTFVATQSPFEATNPNQQVFLDSIALPAAMLTNKVVAPPKGTFPRLTPSLTKIDIDFNNVDTGVFVFHCHMLFHEDHGMMGVIEVLPPLHGPPQKTF
jgi:FtsP/CotA-like multicopper oxidase with cupredoxin domain